MSFIGIIGLLLGLAAAPFASLHMSRTRATFFFIAYLMHIAAAAVYYQSSLTNVSDSNGYYYDYANFATADFELSTVFVVKFVHQLRGWFGGSLFDYFMLFQAFGFIGIVTIGRMIEEIFLSAKVDQPLPTYFILLLPGMHFWSTAIGKDGLLFMGAAMACYAMMAIRSRLILFAIGTAIMLLVRPHIALVAVAALCVTLFFDRNTRPAIKGLLIAIAAASGALIAMTIQSTFNIDVSNADSISDFYARQEDTIDMMGGEDLYNLPFVLRVASLLYRPMFLDAEGFYGLMASIENSIFLCLSAYLIFHWRDVILLTRKLPFVRFAMVFSWLIILMIASVYYNVGLGLRQRTMALPGFIAVLVTVLAMVRARRAAAVPPKPVIGDGAALYTRNAT